MRFLVGTAAALLLLAAAPSFAVEQNCRLIKAKADREACYTKQEKDLAAKRSAKTAPSMSDDLARMKSENDALGQRLKSICRGC